jgi:hypothetical protein
MAKSHVYLASGSITPNVETTDTFATWIDTTNQLVFDMGTVVLTSVNLAQPNTSIGGFTSGNSHLQGIFSANSIVASTELRGGTVSTTADLSITSNTIFSRSTSILVGANTNAFTINANNVVFSSNVAIANTSKLVTISAANTTINAGDLFVRTNANFTGSNFTSSSNTVLTASSLNANVDIITLGFNASDSLTVNSLASFNSNTTINNAFLSLAGSTARTLSVLGTNNAYQNLNITFSNNSISNTAITANTSGLFSAVNQLSSLGNSSVNWRELYVQDSFVTRNEVVSGNTAINGGNLTTSAATFNLINTGATTLNVGGAATTINVGANASTVNIGTTGGNSTLVVRGNGTSGNTAIDTNVTTGNVNLFPSLTSGKINIGSATDLQSVNIRGTTGDLVTGANNALVVSGGAYIAKGLRVEQNSRIVGNETIDGNLTVNGIVTFNSSNVSIAVNTSIINTLTVQQSAIFNGTVSTNFIPSANVTYSLGTSASRWQNVFARELIASNTVTSASITTNSIRAATSAQDAIVIEGGINGTSSRKITIKPQVNAIAADRTITLPDADVTLQGGTMAITGGTLAQFASTTSAQLAGIVSDETGSGSLVFSTSPALTTPTIGGTGANFSGSTSGTTNLRASAAAGSTTITLPATTGTVVTTGDTGSITSTMLANDAVINAANILRTSTVGGFEAARITPTGYFQLSANSPGIVFGGAATNTENALNDYEEGTWTPLFSSTGSTFVWNEVETLPIGYYVKIGKLVTCSFRIVLGGGNGEGGPILWSGDGGSFENSVLSSNPLSITGFPFTSAPTYTNSLGGVQSNYSNIAFIRHGGSFSTNLLYVQGRLPGNSTTMSLRALTSTTFNNDLSTIPANIMVNSSGGNAFPPTSGFEGNITYRTI